ncbi:sigma-54-dependent transcriptional regulator [Phocaeicola sartorii]|uniref:sigma-54-dependent transcriptional regulator n=1 Tax=Phocaeicola sartorii TaxID=671267 RepID=UPI00266FB3AD|nr:sigma-54 dependent transcriptional regulator [Phocaeicola sartorii]
MKIIVIEDNPIYSRYVCNLLAKDGYQTESASSLRIARKLAERLDETDIILADLRLPDGECTGLLKWMRERNMPQRFIVMTDYAEVHTAVASMKLGSDDYIPKLLIEDKLLPLLKTIKKEYERQHMEKTPIFRRMGKKFNEIKERIRLVAPTDMSVLILGENGTGKEHIARTIHAQSKRAGKQFVSVDCGSISPTLAQSAFWGHVKGAFTGAECNKSGYFQEANGGTLFLDEVGNLPYETQQMLLRAIQERRYRPVGAKKDCIANARIIAATNENLCSAIEKKQFRQDLFYRLRDYIINVPPLRESKEDILPLADFFRELANKELGRHTEGFDKEAEQVLLTHAWVGNVRELKQTVNSAVLLTEGKTICADKLVENLSLQTSSSFLLRNDNEEKERITRALEQTEGNREMAAGLLGISRTTLYNKMKEYRIVQKKQGI